MAVGRQAGAGDRGGRDERGDESERMHLVDWIGLMKLQCCKGVKTRRTGS